MAIRTTLLLVVVAALGALTFAASKPVAAQAEAEAAATSPGVGFLDVVRHHARAGIAAINSGDGLVVVHLAPAWDADTGEGHDAERHWSLAEVGDGWVRFQNAAGGEVFAQLDHIVVRRG